MKEARANKSLAFSTVVLLLLPTIATAMVLAPVPFLPAASAQDDPPPFGEGDWSISTPTTITDDTIRVKGNVFIRNGGILTLSNSTLLLQMTTKYDKRIEVEAGGQLKVYNGSFIGAFDASYAIYVQPGSALHVKDSTISNIRGIPIGSMNAVIEDSLFSTLYYGIFMWGGSVNIHNTTFSNSNNGIWNVHGRVDIDNSTFFGNGIGIWEYPLCHNIDPGNELYDFVVHAIAGPIGTRCAGPRDLYSYDNLFEYSLFAGLRFAMSYGKVQDCIIRDSMDYGIFVQNADLDLIDNLFQNHVIGLFVGYLDETSTIINLVNNDFQECSNYAILYQEMSVLTGTWTVTKEVEVDSRILTRTPITIKEGGHMHFNATDLVFLPMAVPLGTTVEDGGSLLFENSSMGLTGGWGTGLYFEAKPGSEVVIRDSVLDEVGYSWGTYGQWAGVYSEGELLIERSDIGHGAYGVVSGGGHTRIVDSKVHNGTYGIYGSGGLLEAYDTIVADTAFYDIGVDDGEVDLYNVSLKKGKYEAKGGTLDVYWGCQLSTMWQNGEPVGDVPFEVREAAGTGGDLVASGVTGSDGLSGSMWLREFTDSGQGSVSATPHNITGTVMGLTNSSDVLVSTNAILPLYLEDDQLPWLNITYPGTVVHQTSNTLAMNGTAGDDESGLDRVQWSFDRDLWFDTNGTGQWDFEVTLKYGTIVIFVRALDLAGNEAVVKLTVTIDKDAPYLVLMSPKEGDVTPLRTILVEGYAEVGSTVTVNGMSAVSLDGTFRMSVPLQEGANFLFVSAVDGTGNTNSTAVTVFRDTLPPEIDIVSPPEDYISNDPRDLNLAIRGSTEVGALLYVNGRSVPLWADGTFNFTIGLEDGLNVITFLVADAVGNQNTTMRRVVFDQTLPDLTVYSPEDGTYTNLTSIHVSGLTEASASVTAVAGNFTTTVAANREGRFTLEVGLEEGENTVVVTASDAAGNAKPVTVRVSRDTVPPQIDLGSVHDGMVTVDTTILLEGQSEAGARVKVDNELITVGYTGKFSKWVPLPSANNTIVVEAVDKAGNRNVSVVHVLRKPKEEPVPQGPSLGPDYFPWVAVIVILVLALATVAHVIIRKRRADSAEAEPATGRGGVAGMRRRRPTPQRHYPRPGPEEAAQTGDWEEGPRQRVTPRRQGPRDSGGRGGMEEEDGGPEFEDGGDRYDDDDEITLERGDV